MKKLFIEVYLYKLFKFRIFSGQDRQKFNQLKVLDHEKAYWASQQFQQVKKPLDPKKQCYMAQIGSVKTLKRLALDPLKVAGKRKIKLDKAVFTLPLYLNVDWCALGSAPLQFLYIVACQVGHIKYTFRGEHSSTELNSYLLNFQSKC